MPKKGKKFIDKKNAVSFHLVNRSQQDPLIADETAPQHVLVPVTKRNESKSNKEKRLEEQHKYGIYYDDDHNYLQHLKDIKDNEMEWPEHVEKELKERKKVKIQLPSSVFASEVEEKVGMLGKAAPISGPQLHLDPDVVAAMDEDFDYDDPENELEDNFIELANGVASDQEFDDEFERAPDAFDEREEDLHIDSDGATSNTDSVNGMHINSDEAMSDTDSVNGMHINSDEAMSDTDSVKGTEHSFREEETKSRITRYSLTSSVLPRNENLQLLDRYFEKKIVEYDDDQIGMPVRYEDEKPTPIADAMIKQYAEEYIASLEDKNKGQLDKDEVANEKTKSLHRMMTMRNKKTEYVMVPVEAPKPETRCKFFRKDARNCGKVPRMFTDGPGVIDVPPSLKKIKLSKRLGIPVNEISSYKAALKALNSVPNENTEEDTQTRHSITSRLSELSIRPKDETPEQKRQRKHLLKEYRRERRSEKKANVLAFKEERKKQEKIEINNLKNVQGQKLL